MKEKTDGKETTEIHKTDSVPAVSRESVSHTAEQSADGQNTTPLKLHEVSEEVVQSATAQAQKKTEKTDLSQSQKKTDFSQSQKKTEKMEEIFSHSQKKAEKKEEIFYKI